MELRYIIVEGLQGAGKSTVIPFLESILREINENIEIVLVREPGGTESAEKIRDIVKYKTDEQFSPYTEALLMCAARTQVILNVVKPALKNNKIVISDRNYYSTIAYQGAGRGIDEKLLLDINKAALGEITHDLCIYLDVPPEVSQNRIKLRDRKNLDRFEQENHDFSKKVRDKYLELVKSDDNSIIIDASQEIENVKQQIKVKIFEFLTRNSKPQVKLRR